MRRSLPFRPCRDEGVCLGVGEGKIDADVGPAGFPINAEGMALDFRDVSCKHVREFFACVFNVCGIAKGFHNDVGGFKADGELMAEASVIGRCEKGRELPYVRDSAEIEIALTVFSGVFEFLDSASGGSDSAPADAARTMRRKNR